jgi:hypothetical protein
VEVVVVVVVVAVPFAEEPFAGEGEGEGEGEDADKGRLGAWARERWVERVEGVCSVVEKKESSVDGLASRLRVGQAVQSGEFMWAAAQGTAEKWAMADWRAREERDERDSEDMIVRFWFWRVV